VPVYRETLPNGVSYTTLDLNPNSPGDNTREFVVPEGHYFMMGDNRDNSQDSRFEVGFVPLENFIGRATIIFFSIGEDAHRRWRSGNGRLICVLTGFSNLPSDDTRARKAADIDRPGRRNGSATDSADAGRLERALTHSSPATNRAVITNGWSFSATGCLACAWPNCFLSISAAPAKVKCRCG
jgi:hypothetical protein